MKVIIDGGETVDLGTTETTPTIGITDYSRRVTDDFGVTTVVPRGFSRRLSVKMALATDTVDGVQRRLADLRASSALWVAEEGAAWLSARGFYKDFEIDLAVPPLSFCTLTVEGLAETEIVADPGGDPAPDGQVSTMRLLQPFAITDAGLAASSVPEADAPAWAAGVSYAQGAQVVRSHRVWESLSNGNLGNDPIAGGGKWLDTGPTNRWAMFDQALGTTTDATGAISVTLATIVTADAIALLDVAAQSARVRVTNGAVTIYDQSVAVAGRAALMFRDLPHEAGSQIVVDLTAAAPGGAVSIGTMLAGHLVALGLTESSPTAGITDFSRKEVDDFGEVTVVQRAWSKRMSVRALIRSDEIDVVANRIAAVRAVPALWIGELSLDSLTIYGFFKDFAIEVGESVSKLSLSIEGLSKAAPIAETVPVLTPVGDYDAATMYGENNLVLYQGSTWRYAAKVASAGHAPPTLPTTANDWWRLFAQGGTGGSTGATGATGATGPAGPQGPQGIAGTNGTNGLNGTNGAAGPAGSPGAPGQTTRVHFAYADSADGTSNFTTGDAEGRAFVGVYVDFTEADSGSPGAYVWTRLRGLDGANGIPGSAGANGLTTYVHVVYASSADGSVNFHVSDPTGRSYIGVRTDYTLADSTNYADYTWSLIKGADGAPGANGATGATGSPGAPGSPGSPGAPGANAINLTSNVASLSFAADYLGNVKSGQLGQVVKFTLTDGPADVSASVVWGFEASGCSAAMSSSGLVSFSGVTADGYVRATATYAGVSRTQKVPTTLSKDPAPPATDATSSTFVNADVTSTSYPGGPQGVTIVTVANGVLRGQLSAAYDPDDQGNCRLEGIFAYRLAGTSNAWSYFDTSTIGSQARISYGGSEPINETGYLTMNDTKGVSNARYEVGIFLRRYSGARNGYLQGTLQASNG